MSEAKKDSLQEAGSDLSLKGLGQAEGKWRHYTMAEEPRIKG